MSNNPDKIRILHFSDIHAGINDFSLAYLLDKRICGRGNQLLFRQKGITQDTINALAAKMPELAPDYVICTGDLTSIGSENEFDKAESWMKPILNHILPDRFFYVPGNHDAYVNEKKSEAALARFLKKYARGSEKIPCRMELDGFDLILINAARPCIHWLSTGELSPEAWNELDHQIDQRRPGIPLLLACHFPWAMNAAGKPLCWRTRLEQWNRMKKWAKEGRYDAMLSGHVHRAFIHQETDSNWLVCAGSLTLFHTYSVIDIDRKTGKISARLCRL